MTLLPKDRKRFSLAVESLAYESAYLAGNAFTERQDPEEL
jgi:hypothetical protein